MIVHGMSHYGASLTNEASMFGKDYTKEQELSDGQISPGQCIMHCPIYCWFCELYVNGDDQWIVHVSLGRKHKRKLKIVGAWERIVMLIFGIA